LKKKNEGYFSKKKLICLTTIAFFLLSLLGNILYQDEISKFFAYDGSMSKRLATGYEIIKNNQKIATIYDYDKFKDYVLTKYKDQITTGDGKILFEDSVSVIEKYDGDKDAVDDIATYDKVVKNVKFVAKAVEVVEVNSGKKYYVPNLKVWENSIKKIQKGISTPDSKNALELKSNITYSVTEAPIEQVSTSDDIVRKIMNDKNEKYITQPGDTLSSIADKYKITRSELLLLNPTYNVASTLMPNTEVAVTTPEYKNKFTQVNVVTRTEPLPYAIEYIDDDTLFDDQEEILVKGEDGAEHVQLSIKRDENDEEVLLNKFTLMHLKDPVTQVVRRGTKSQPHLGTGTFIWPTKSHRTSTEFGGDYLFGQYRFHSGMDINEGLNAHIVASDNGVVIINEYSPAYGNYVVIDHNNGYYTLYGHMNKSNVHRGQTVAQGELIGYMGSTGLSTGNHVHFEIRSGGNAKQYAQDPRYYIGN